MLIKKVNFLVQPKLCRQAATTNTEAMTLVWTYGKGVMSLVDMHFLWMMNYIWKASPILILHPNLILQLNKLN